MRKTLLTLSVAGVLSSLALGQATQPSAPYDVLIRNGRVMDGTGNPWLRADIGVRGGRIEAMGRLGDARATTIIDAADRLVTPGFIDVHSHAAEGLRRQDLRQGQPLLAQGITTILANPDGGGPVDLAAQRAELEKSGIGVNVGLLIGHGAVRRAVVGGDNRAPTPDELERMKDLVRRGMKEGAFGLSSGLFYTPGSYAKTEEVIALAAAAGESGGLYTSHVRDEGNYEEGVVASVLEVIRIAEEGKVIGIFSHAKALGPDSWGLSMALMRRIEDARARGVQVFADQYPYEASSTNLRAALLPLGVAVPKPEDAATPPGQAAPDAPIAVLRENMRRRGGPAAIQIAHFKAEPALEGKNLAEIARARGVSPEAAAIDILSRGGASIVSFNMSEEDIEHIMRQPFTMTSSDGGLVAMTEGKPHPRNYGAFARKLARYTRERGTVGIEFAIRSMTSLPASVFGMSDRGVLRPGAAADIAIFDPALVRDRATYTDPHQLAEGMAWVLVNGTAVVQDGRFTAAMPGRVLRK